MYFSGFYGIGPNIPADIVPDSGSGVVLLAFSVLMIACLRKPLAAHG
jgi:hypothetical protein